VYFSATWKAKRWDQCLLWLNLTASTRQSQCQTSLDLCCIKDGGSLAASCLYWSRSWRKGFLCQVQAAPTLHSLLLAPGKTGPAQEAVRQWDASIHFSSQLPSTVPWNCCSSATQCPSSPNFKAPPNTLDSTTPFFRRKVNKRGILNSSLALWKWAELNWCNSLCFWSIKPGAFRGCNLRQIEYHKA
jgi:hypothetical protein